MYFLKIIIKEMCIFGLCLQVLYISIPQWTQLGGPPMYTKLSMTINTHASIYKHALTITIIESRMVWFLLMVHCRLANATQRLVVNCDANLGRNWRTWKRNQITPSYHLNFYDKVHTPHMGDQYLQFHNFTISTLCRCG